MKQWDMLSVRSAKHYSYKFEVVREDDTYFYVNQILADEPPQEMALLKLSPDIKLFLGVMGTIHAGKDTVLNRLKEKGVFMQSTHAITANALQGLGIPEYRDSLEGIGSFLAVNWPVVWVNKVIDACNKSGAEYVAFNGVRLPSDLILSRLAAGGRYTYTDAGARENDVICTNEGRAQFILVDADESVRYERMRERKRVGDGETKSEFYYQQFNEELVFWVDKTMTMVDQTITNNDAIGVLNDKVDELWNKLMGEIK